MGTGALTGDPSATVGSPAAVLHSRMAPSALAWSPAPVTDTLSPLLNPVEGVTARVGAEGTRTGETGGPKGWRRVMPEGRMVSLRYDVHVKLAGGAVSLPLAETVRLIDRFWETDTVPPVAVKGPTVTGVVDRTTPDDGTGFGMGTSKLKVPDGSEAGVAPTASSVVVALPVIDVLPRAAAADTTAAGSVS
jgi:hypothetical protein